MHMNESLFASRCRAASVSSQGSRGFTLVELTVGVAIIGNLMIVALPAYNNYSTKSKFSEVVLATAPTKTAISACAVSGDCISGNAITLNSGSAGSQGVNLTGGQLAVFGNLYAFANTIDAEAGVSPTQEALSLVQAGYGIVEGGPFCFNNSSLFCVAVPNGQPDLPAGHMFLTPSQIITGQVGAPTTNAQIMAALNGGAASSNLPCVGRRAPIAHRRRNTWRPFPMTTPVSSRRPRKQRAG